MKENNDLQVILKAKELATHTFKVTSNSNHIPKKFRHSLVDKMQIKTLEIYENLLEANRLDLALYKPQRISLMNDVINYCDELLFFIELTQSLGFLGNISLEYWVKKVTDVKYMTLALRTKDKNR